MRGSVEAQLEMLQSQLSEAHEKYAEELAASRDDSRVAEAPAAEGAPIPEADLAPMLRENLDKLWSRSYECRVFVLQASASRMRTQQSPAHSHTDFLAPSDCVPPRAAAQLARGTRRPLALHDLQLLRALP